MTSTPTAVRRWRKWCVLRQPQTNRTDTTGRVAGPSAATTEFLDPQLPETSLHALRHGCATVTLEAGFPVKAVHDRLNRASERITDDIHTHVCAPLQSDAAERVAAFRYQSFGLRH